MGNLDYGVIGNCRSAALVSKKGSIDWCCLPDFTSPSVFAGLLDRESGGHFGVEVEEGYLIEQNYRDRTNILVTRFHKGRDAFEILDFMPRYKSELNHYHTPPDVVRYVRRVSGAPKARFIYEPRLAYSQHETKMAIEEDCIKSYTANGQYESVYLYTDFNYKSILHAEPVNINGNHFFLLSYNQKLLDLDIIKIQLEYQRTKLYWLNWVDGTKSYTSYNNEILRSALVLKLLTYNKTGAILAAVTTSLPEIIGADRNWDYRFCWIRDASMIVATLTALGHYHSAQRFLNFITDVIPYKDEKMQIMYGIRGEKKLEERELPWLSGYENSKPVRVGNAAYKQKQNDIYGVLIDLLYQYFKLYRHSLANSEELWTIVRGLIRTVAKTWMKRDTSIWEYRTQQRHFTFSKVLSWVAIDRGVKIANLLGKEVFAREWTILRDKIKKDILRKGWNPTVQAFTQSYESDNMDAANLLMLHYGFISANDPKYVMTVKKTKEELCRNGLMYRYRNRDDFGEPMTSFTICTFWLIKSLYLIGERDEAIQMFEQVLTYANHLGLFSEGIDFTSKRLLGNFPQGYSHLALIDAAMTLAGKEIEEEDILIEKLGTQQR